MPDISKWNINKVNYMYGFFYECSSLKELPDISKWNLEKNEDISYLFYGCSSLITFINDWPNNLSDKTESVLSNEIINSSYLSKDTFSFKENNDVNLSENNSKDNSKDDFKDNSKNNFKDNSGKGELYDYYDNFFK